MKRMNEIHQRELKELEVDKLTFSPIPSLGL